MHKNMQEENSPLEFMIKRVDPLTALSFFFRPIRIVSANTLFSKSTRFIDLEDYATSNVVPCDRPLLFFVHLISLLIPS